MKNHEMKFLLATVVCVLFPFLMNAQFLLGGNVNYRTSQYESTDQESFSKSITFSPEIAFQLKPNHLLGLRYSYSSYTYQDDVNNPESGNSSNAISLFNRMRKPLSDRLNLYGEIELKYANWNSPEGYIGIPEKTKQERYSINASPGLEFKLTKNFLLYSRMGLMGFHHTKITQESKTETGNVFEIGVRPSNVVIGLNYIFGNKKDQ